MVQNQVRPAMLVRVCRRGARADALGFLLKFSLPTSRSSPKPCLSSETPKIQGLFSPSFASQVSNTESTLAAPNYWCANNLPPSKDSLDGSFVPPDSLLSTFSAPLLDLGHRGAVIKASPVATRFWDKLSLGPVGGRKDVLAFAVYESTGPALNAQVKKWLGQMGEAYEVGGARVSCFSELNRLTVDCYTYSLGASESMLLHLSLAFSLASWPWTTLVSRSRSVSRFRGHEF